MTPRLTMMSHSVSPRDRSGPPNFAGNDRQRPCRNILRGSPSFPQFPLLTIRSEVAPAAELLAGSAHQNLGNDFAGGTLAL